MPNPTKISLPRIDYHFEESACEQVLTVMLNKVDKDYSTVDELAEHDELSMFTRDEIKKAVSELNGRKFLLKVDKPYGCVYAVNKLYIPNMGIYDTPDEADNALKALHDWLSTEAYAVYEITGGDA